MTSQPFMQYEHEDGGVTARWHGGEYISLGTVRDIAGQPGIDGDDFHAYDVINVWDYAERAPRIPVTLAAFAAAVVAHLEQDSESDHA